MSARLHVAPERLRAGPLIIDGDDYRYLFRVLRLAVGAELVLFDGAGRQARARVGQVAADRATLEVGDPASEPPPPLPHIISLVSLIKGERMDWCIQKLVEVGADRIVAVATERAVVRLEGSRADRRRERWQAIARDAARQCRRPTIPEVGGPVPLAEALAAAVAPVRVLLWAGADRTLGQVLPAEAPPAVTLLTGPEGDLTGDEVARCEAAGFVLAGLGPRVLRAETAAMVAATIVTHRLRDLG
jgi:16S rRNA (uracil1498-N3)-methyltransferase